MAGAAGDRPDEGVGGGGDDWPFAGEAFADYSSAVFAELGGWPGAGAGEPPALDPPAVMAPSDDMPADADGASSSSSGAAAAEHADTGKLAAAEAAA